MIDYYKCSLDELDKHLRMEQDNLNKNPLDASATARYRNIVLLIKRKHVEDLINATKK